MMHWLLGYRLAVGSIEDGQDAYLQSLAPLPGEQPLTRILNLCEHTYDSDMPVLHRPISDEVWLPPSTWQHLVNELTELLLNDHNVLVHCRLGVSRSPALCAAYVAIAGVISPQKALAHVQARRTVAKPHPETWRGVLEWWEGRKEYGT